jgi:hypothetical protein
MPGARRHTPAAPSVRGRRSPGPLTGRVGVTPVAAELPAYLAETPHIVNVTAPGTEWSRLGEMAVPEAA